MLIVAVHDVAPSELTDVRWLLGQLDAIGVKRRVLKVVPAEAAVHAAPAFVELLRREQAAGSELVLHGWSHRVAGRIRGAAVDRLRARLFAPEAAEFLSIGSGEAEHRLAAGLGWLHDAGLEARGFCPPGWLAGPRMPALLRRVGFGYLITLPGLQDLRDGRRVMLPPVGYMGAGAGQELLVRLGASLVARPLRWLARAPAHRVFLHPQGAADSADCRRVLEDVARLAERHEHGTYGELLGA